MAGDVSLLRECWQRVAAGIVTRMGQLRGAGTRITSVTGTSQTVAALPYGYTVGAAVNP